MKNLLTILLLSSTTIAHGQSWEIGLRGGITDNIVSTDYPSVNYTTVNGELYLRHTTKKRLAIEFFADHYEHGTWGGRDTAMMFDAPPAFTHIAQEGGLYDSHLDYGIRIQYRIGKRATTKPFQHYIGVLLSCDRIHTTGHTSYTSLDTNYSETDWGSNVWTTPKIGFNYLCQFELNRCLNMECLLSYTLLTDNIDGHSGRFTFPSFQPIDPKRCISIQFGIGYKLFHIKQKTNKL